MKYTEKQGDLFKADPKYYLAHCISSDFALAAGIAVEFQKRFGTRDVLMYNHSDLIGKFPIVIPTGRVFNLVTKKNCWDKPKMKDLETTLCALKWLLKQLGIKYLAIPKIGCGIDGLDWDFVSATIKSVFEDTDIEILVCYL